ncbi:MAG: ATP-dependent Clp protease proteolytic subunit [Candidatus Delongbacteria bacterium]|nr:ATP-dependent Clp protease proteolytic subunit [Candidatus Delongbacteria bacterium]
MIISNPEKERDDNLVVFNRMLKTRSIIISGEINQALVERVAQQLFILQDDSDDPIKVFINSQGGHVESGDTIYDLLHYVKPPIIMIGTGWVASAAITIYLGAAKSNRYSLPNTRYLIHQPSGGVMGSASDIKIEAEEILKIRKRVNELISRETGQSLKRVESDTERNYWMSAKEAKEYGIVTHIIQNQKEIK